MKLGDARRRGRGPDGVRGGLLADGGAEALLLWLASMGGRRRCGGLSGRPSRARVVDVRDLGRARDVPRDALAVVEVARRARQARRRR